MQNLVTGLRRVAIERVDRAPSAAPIRLGNEADAFGILEDQRSAEALRSIRHLGCQSLRELLEIIGERVRGAVVHAPHNVCEARDSRIALGY